MRSRYICLAGAVAVALALPAAPASAGPVARDLAVGTVATGSASPGDVLLSWSRFLPYLLAGNLGCAIAAATGSAYAPVGDCHT